MLDKEAPPPAEPDELPPSNDSEPPPIEDNVYVELTNFHPDVESTNQHLDEEK